MKVKIDSRQLDNVQTVYEFAADFKKVSCIKDELVSAEIIDADARGNETGHTIVQIVFKRQAHALTLDEVAEFMDVNYVLVGTLLDNKTKVLLGVGAN